MANTWKALGGALGVSMALALTAWQMGMKLLEASATILQDQVPPEGLQVVSLMLPPASITVALSCSVNGDVRFFDPRMPESVNVMQIVKGLTALDIHPQANLIAW